MTPFDVPRAHARLLARGIETTPTSSVMLPGLRLPGGLTLATEAELDAWLDAYDAARRQLAREAAPPDPPPAPMPGTWYDPPPYPSLVEMVCSFCGRTSELTPWPTWAAGWRVQPPASDGYHPLVACPVCAGTS